jgi:hypothetical protein
VTITYTAVVSRALTIGYRPRLHQVRGHLISTVGACIAHRTVTLWRSRPGPDRRIGMTTTRADGGWVIPRRLRFGRVYYARAPRVTVTRVGVCRAAVSTKLERSRR